MLYMILWMIGRFDIYGARYCNEKYCREERAYYIMQWGIDSGDLFWKSVSGVQVQTIYQFSLYKQTHDDVIRWKHFPRYWPFVRVFTGDRWIPRPKASDTELWCFLFICALINGWVNNCQAGDLRCHRGNYGVTVMSLWITYNSSLLI